MRIFIRTQDYETEIEALFALRSRLDAGEIQMDWHLMLRVIDSFVPVFHGLGGIDSTYERAKNWYEEWLMRANPQWIAVLCDLITNPVPQLIPAAWLSDFSYLHEYFKMLLWELTRRFPDETAEAIIVLLSNLETRHLALMLIIGEYDPYF